MPSLDTMMSYHRLKKAPLDDSEVFKNVNELMNYCVNGAIYDGQRVVVLNNTYGSVEYTIKNNIPMINMRGSEPIFKSITFSGDSTATHGILIYENNLGGMWEKNEVFNFNEGKFCIINQLGIFRILDVTGNKTYKFYLERQTRDSNNIYTAKWNQNYNAYDDASSNKIASSTSGATINKMSFESTVNGWLKTNNSDIILMPKTTAGINTENKYITRIYVKAEDYYQAWNN